MAYGQSFLKPNPNTLTRSGSVAFPPTAAPAVRAREASACDLGRSAFFPGRKRDPGLVSLECGESYLDTKSIAVERGVELAERVKARFVGLLCRTAEILEVDHPELDRISADRDAYVARFEIAM